MKEIHFKTASELLAALRRSNEHWLGNSKSWIFRGQSDSSWPLLPSALRPNQKELTHHPARQQGPYPITSHQIGQELNAVFNFVQSANYHGLPIPGVSGSILQTLQKDWLESDRAMNNWEQFPKNETIEAFALAQHYGIPTRLLDWSRNPLTAAYFAATGAAENLNKGDLDGNFSVWCLQTWVVNFQSDIENEKIVIVDPPRFPNPNLLAQNGVFTLHKHPINNIEKTIATPLDQVVATIYKSSLDRCPTIEPLSDVLIHFTLPKTESRILLVLLEDEDMTAAKLFPGYDGIVKELKESFSLRQSYRSPPERH